MKYIRKPEMVEAVLLDSVEAAREMFEEVTGDGGWIVVTSGSTLNRLKAGEWYGVRRGGWPEIMSKEKFESTYAAMSAVRSVGFDVMESDYGLTIACSACGPLGAVTDKAALREAFITHVAEEHA